MKEITDIVYKIEQEMVGMWASGEVKHVMNDDPEFVNMIMTAVMLDKEHFRAMGLEIGEA